MYTSLTIMISSRCRILVTDIIRTGEACSSSDPDRAVTGRLLESLCQNRVPVERERHLDELLNQDARLKGRHSNREEMLFLIHCCEG